MKLSVSCTLMDGKITVSVTSPISASEVRYFYTLYTQKGAVLHSMPELQGSQTYFDLVALA